MQIEPLFIRSDTFNMVRSGKFKSDPVQGPVQTRWWGTHYYTGAMEIRSKLTIFIKILNNLSPQNYNIK